MQCFLLYFAVPVKELTIISHPFIENIWEGETLTLQCSKTKGTYVSYDWFRNDAPVQMPYDRNNDTLTIHRVSAQNTGDYKCVASNQFNETTIFNSSIDVTVYINGTIRSQKNQSSLEMFSGFKRSLLSQQLRLYLFDQKYNKNMKYYCDLK